MIQVTVGTYRVRHFGSDDWTTVYVSPFVLLQCEERWPGRKSDLTDCMPIMAGLLFSMWVAVDRPGDEREFYASVHTIEMVEADAVDPSQKELSDA